MNYDKKLKELYEALVINIVKHDTSPTGFPCYVEAHLGAVPKDKGATALDLGNYLFRLGFRFQSIPEYRGSGKATTLRWFMSWDDVAPIQKNICDAFGSKVLAKDWLPVGFQSLIIQNKGRGVVRGKAEL